MFKIIQEIKRFGGGLWITEYPTKTCTPMMVENDLGRLATYHNFIPDVVITDYSGIMIPDEKVLEYRHRVTSISSYLRKIASERNILVLDGYQSSKLGKKAKTVEADHAEENKQVIGITDLCLTLSSTEEEWKDRICRINIAASREVEGRKQIEIVYNLDIGQMYGYERLKD